MTRTRQAMDRLDTFLNAYSCPDCGQVVSAEGRCECELMSAECDIESLDRAELEAVDWR